MPATRNTFALWSVAALLVIGVHGLTLRIDPLIAQDEVQVLDYGRTVLHPDTDWAMSWNVGESRPVLQPPYPAVALQELAYRALSPSHLGPRILSVLAAAMAAACALGWLLARRVPATAAAVLALAFLLDPIFTSTYRGARVDAWAFAACFAACWLLRGRVVAGRAEHSDRRRLVAAGALAALAPFLWPAVVVLWSLVLVEFVESSRQRHESRTVRMSSSLSRDFLWLCLGGLGGVLILSPPILIDLQAYASGLETMFDVQYRAAAIQQPLHHVLGVHDPLIFIAAIGAVLVRREPGLLVALLVAVLLVYRTMVYPPRAMYLVPYFLAIIGGACQILATRRSFRWEAPLLRWMLALLLAWNAGVVLVYRPAAAWLQRGAGDPGPVSTALQGAIGPGPKRVLMEEWYGYYAGRALGWHMFNPGSPVSLEQYRAFLATMDYIVVREQPLYDTTAELARQLGFERHAILRFAQDEPKHLPLGAVSVPLPARGYTPLIVYRNPATNAPLGLDSGT